MSRTPEASDDFEGRLGRALVLLTLVSVALLVCGVALMFSHGIGPLATSPTFRPDRLVADLLALDPAAPLWLGLIVVLVTPIVRVIVAGAAYARQGQWAMAGIATAVVIVIAIGVGSALVTEN